MLSVEANHESCTVLPSYVASNPLGAVGGVLSAFGVGAGAGTGFGFGAGGSGGGGSGVGRGAISGLAGTNEMLVDAPSISFTGGRGEGAGAEVVAGGVGGGRVDGST
jgi:hypothetical protein